MRAHVRTFSFFSLSWLVTTVLALLAMCPLAHGATATWNQVGEAEHLTLRFDFRLLDTTPRKKKSTLLLPVRWSVWQRERKPKSVDFSSSALLKGIAVTQEGIEIATNSTQFSITIQTRPKTKELVLVFRDPAITAARETSRQANTRNQTQAVQADPGSTVLSDAVHTTATALQDKNPDIPTDTNRTSHTTHASADLGANTSEAPFPHADHGLSSSGAPSLRTKVARPEPFRVRQTITRENATLSHSATAQREPETAPEINIMDMGNSSGPDKTDADNASQQGMTSVDLPQETNTSDVGSSALGTERAEAPQALEPDAPLVSTETRLPGAAQENAGQNTTTEQVGVFSSEIMDAAGTEENASSAIQPAQDYEPVFAAFHDALARDNVEAARQAMVILLQAPVSPEMREVVLYGWADLLMRESRGRPADNFRAIEDAYLMAMNNDVRSPRVPKLLHDLGYLNLAVGNGPEARAYFGFLRKRYPDDPHLPMTDLYLGQYYIENKKYQKAADHFQYVLQKYPQTEFIAPATIGLFTCLNELKYTDRAFEMLNDMEHRWPASALRDEQFLFTAGLVSLHHSQPDRAKEYFWRYYNLFPKAGQRDTALAHIGDILLSQGQHKGAREVYERILAEFPGKDPALVALMRLAEEGILEETNPRDAKSPYPDRQPQKIYERILRNPDSPLAPVARLKLAMWQYKEKNYPQTLAEAGEFLRDYPRHELVPKAREVGDQAMSDWIVQNMQAQDFAGVVSAWTKHQQWFDGREPDPGLRLAVASAFFKENKPDQAIELAQPLVFGSAPQTKYSDQAMDLLLSTFVERRDWPKVIDIANHVRAWTLSPAQQRQVDYAAALAHENLEQHAHAKPLWAKLATDLDLAEDQRTYALYFLARTAMAEGDVEQADIFGQEALTALQKTNADTAKIKEMLDMLSRTAEARGRLSDALTWANEYEELIGEDHDEWPTLAYRKALLFKKNGDLPQWRALLERIMTKAPASLYSRMASTELESIRLGQELGKIR